MDALSRSRGLEIRKRAKNGLWHRLCWRNLVFFVAPRSHRAANLLAMTIENKISSIGRVWFLSNISLRWAVALIAAVLFVLLAGTWLTAKRLTDDLLKKDATEDARAWAEFLAANVHDLEQIAAGEQPSTTSLSFFEATNKTGQVLRYVIYNREGYSQLVSDHRPSTPRGPYCQTRRQQTHRRHEGGGRTRA
jgi:hypothetical protein